MKNKAKGQIMKRRTYYIKKSYQRRFIIKKISLVVIGALAANGLLYIFIQKWINDAMYRVHINVSSASDVIMTPLLFTNLIIFSLAVGGSFLMISFGRRRLERQFQLFIEGLRSLNKGNLTVEAENPPDGDFTELIYGFNRTVRLLSGKINSLKDGISEIESIAGKYEAGSTSMQLDLKSRLEMLEKEFSTIKLMRLQNQTERGAF